MTRSLLDCSHAVDSLCRGSAVIHETRCGRLELSLAERYDLLQLEGERYGRPNESTPGDGANHRQGSILLA